MTEIPLQAMLIRVPDGQDGTGNILRFHLLLGCANKDLWDLCAPIFIIVVYCRTATNYFFGGKE